MNALSEYLPFSVTISRAMSSGPGQLIADERGKGSIELALGLDRDRVEDDGRLAEAGHADKHRDLVLRDAQRHTLEVVLSAPTTRIVSQRSS
jgi:hypothetical protein